MKKLLIIQESLDGGGAERVLIEYLNHIDYTLYDVSLLLVYGEGRYQSEINKNVHCYELYRRWIKPKNRIWESLLYNTKILKCRLRKTIKNNSFDTILSFMEGPALLVHQTIIEHARLNVTMVHTNMITNPWSERILGGKKNENKAYEKMDRISFVSLQAKKAFSEKFPNVHSELIVINNPINAGRIIRSAEEIKIDKQRDFTICSVGRMVEAKRFDRLVDVAKILKDKGYNIKYWICGAGKLEEQFKKQIHDNEMNNEFVLWGFQNNPYPYIKAADMFVLTSDTEGFPTVVCEALVLGKPVISTDVPGIDELLENSKYGVVCSKNIKSVAEAIMKLYDSRELLAKYSKMSLERSSFFDIGHIMEKFYKFVGN